MIEFLLFLFFFEKGMASKEPVFILLDEDNFISPNLIIIFILNRYEIMLEGIFNVIKILRDSGTCGKNMNFKTVSCVW